MYIVYILQHGGGTGGGVISLEATHQMLVDGEITVNGASTYVSGTGGGAGGSIFLKAPYISGKRPNDRGEDEWNTCLP